MASTLEARCDENREEAFSVISSADLVDQIGELPERVCDATEFSAYRGRVKSVVRKLEKANNTEDAELAELYEIFDL